MKEDSAKAQPFFNEDEGWSYMVMEPRELYDEAMLGLLPINFDMDEGSDHNFTHVAIYCRIKTLMCLSSQIEGSDWDGILEFHYFNQDRMSVAPYPLFVDPPQDWEEMERYQPLFERYSRCIEECDSNSED